MNEPSVRAASWAALSIVATLIACTTDDAARSDEGAAVVEASAAAPILGAWGHVEGDEQLLITFCPGGVGAVKRGKLHAHEPPPIGEAWRPTQLVHYGAHPREGGLFVDVTIRPTSADKALPAGHAVWNVSRTDDALAVTTLSGLQAPAAMLKRVDDPEACSTLLVRGKRPARAIGRLVVLAEGQQIFDGELGPGDRLPGLVQGREMALVDFESYGGYGAAAKIALLDPATQAYADVFFVFQEHPEIAAETRPDLRLTLSGWPSETGSKPMGSSLTRAEVNELASLVTAAHQGADVDRARLAELLKPIDNGMYVYKGQPSLRGAERSEAARAAEAVEILFRTRHFVLCLDHVNDALNRWPDDPALLNLKGRALYFLGQHDAGRVVLLRGLKHLDALREERQLTEPELYLYVDSLFILGALVVEGGWMSDRTRLADGIYAWERYQELAPQSSALDHVQAGLKVMKARLEVAPD